MGMGVMRRDVICSSGIFRICFAMRKLISLFFSLAGIVLSGYACWNVGAALSGRPEKAIAVDDQGLPAIKLLFSFFSHPLLITR